MVDLDDDDTTPTEEDGVLDQLRRDGILGPFAVTDWSAGSDVGLTRTANEDAWDVTNDRLFVVADGIGGHDGGALAARTAVETMTRFGDGMTEASGRELAARTNRAVVDAGLLAGIERLGTTLVALAAHRTHVVVLNAGDSRVYRVREGELEQLTRDHTVRNELLASGVPLEMAEQSRMRLDALTSFMGRDGDLPTMQIASYSVMAGDRFLLCTDGIHGQIDPLAITAALDAESCEGVVRQLLQLARGRGGRDNATAIVVEFGTDIEGVA